MTIEEQKAIIGGAVLEYAEVKQKLAALEEDLRNKMIKVNEVERAFNMNERTRMQELLKEWPSSDYFTTTLNEIAEKRKQKAALEQTMKQYGIDLP